MTSHDALAWWMRGLEGRSEHTRKNCLRTLDRFCEFTGMTPNQLIDYYDKTHQRGDPRDKVDLEMKLNEFLAHLQTQGWKDRTEGYNPTTLNGNRYMIVSFFKINRRPLNKDVINTYEGESVGHQVASHESIRDAVNYAKSRGKRAAILTQKDSGLRVSDIVRLKWEDVIDYGEGFWGFGDNVTRKRKVVATPFLGPEATAALIPLRRESGRIFDILENSLSKDIARVFDEAGHPHITSHSLRRFFNVELGEVLKNEKHRNRMMGRKTGPYDEYRRERLLKLYKQGYDQLRVLKGSLDLEAVSQRLQKMEHELQEKGELIALQTREMEDTKAKYQILEQAYMHTTKIVSTFDDENRQMKAYQEALRQRVQELERTVQLLIEKSPNVGRLDTEDDVAAKFPASMLSEDLQRRKRELQRTMKGRIQ